ncbi:hypothetical protein AAG570_003294 [Ranatra chinensis]|uniref:Uncharacterized protein n=1 Tax=Ranatra chinensis TaxID=642074 RepID=A0ABD0Y6F8_9HEMI
MSVSYCLGNYEWTEKCALKPSMGERTCACNQWCGESSLPLMIRTETHAELLGHNRSRRLLGGTALFCTILPVRISANSCQSHGVNFDPISTGEEGDQLIPVWTNKLRARDHGGGGGAATGGGGNNGGGQSQIGQHHHDSSSFDEELSCSSSLSSAASRCSSTSSYAIDNLLVFPADSV